MKVSRPVLRYHGGKWMLAPWIISHFPSHRVYVEPFGGAASVLLRKPRSYAEVYNDLDGGIVDFFRVVRDRGDELARVLELTPYARDEYIRAYYPSNDPLEAARRVVVRAFMGFASCAVTSERHVTKAFKSPSTGFRSNSNRSCTTPAHDWVNYPDALKATIDRLRGVVIENRPAVDLIPQHDTPETLFYVDPPYVADTRDAGQDYRHEMTDDDHRQLAEVLHSIEGYGVLSGYDSPLYRELYADWTVKKKKAFADGARERTEMLWLSPNVVELPLFKGMAI